MSAIQSRRLAAESFRRLSASRLRPGRREHGVTLIESLIALLVLAIALLGVASLQLLTQRQEIDARWRSIAVAMSGSLIEQLRTDTVAAEKLAISGNALSGCDATNQWLCNLVGKWQSQVGEQLPNAVIQLQLEGSTDELVMASVSILWQRVASDPPATECRPQDGAQIDDGGCILVETAL
ncbi:type IV pilus modification PilV family protein [Salinicola halimionae]|uniref:type IV pilus modification PilV family protein n=1 Tax=Salinicola halimionae TaxID=1949081 RepID=UPI0013003788|nr:prepilin-type N-terminal cleavage/methylation domain-containing protein [Salinicola halimionae]